LLDTAIGTCGIECGTYKKNGRSLLRSMNCTARSVSIVVSLSLSSGVISRSAFSPSTSSAGVMSFE
jgi:hypothetical protein